MKVESVQKTNGAGEMRIARGKGVDNSSDPTVEGKLLYTSTCGVLCSFGLDTYARTRSKGGGKQICPASRTPMYQHRAEYPAAASPSRVVQVGVGVGVKE